MCNRVCKFANCKCVCHFVNKNSANVISQYYIKKSFKIEGETRNCFICSKSTFCAKSNNKCIFKKLQRTCYKRKIKVIKESYE